MERSNLGASKLLQWVGFASIVIGVGTIAYSAFVLRPRIAALSNEVLAGVSDAEIAADTLNQHIYLLADSLKGLEDGSKILAELPVLLKRLGGVLHQGSHATAATGTAAKESQEGLAGAVLPKDEIKQSSAALKGTAVKMNKLAKSVGNLQSASEGLAKDAKDLAERAADLSPELQTDNPAIHATRERLRSIRHSVEYAALPLQVMLLGATLGGLFVVVGMIALAMALATKNVRA